MRKGDHSKRKSKGARRRGKKFIQYQMKSCLTWEYADDFRNIDNWHESLRDDDYDNNIIKAEHLKKEEDARDDSPNDDYISMGNNCMDQFYPNIPSPKNLSLTDVGPVVKEDPFPPLKFCADIIHEVLSEDQPQRAGSYLAKIAGKINADKPPAHGTPSSTTISDEDNGSSVENVQSSSFHLNCRNSKTIDELTRERQSHSNERTFECTQCPKAFEKQDQLKVHQLTHSNERSFESTQCPKAFMTKDQLKNHQVSHSNERTFKCTQCPKAFKTKDHLKKHQASHSNERIFKCTQCPKAFKRKTALKNHEHTHCGERKYRCTQCPKAFSFSHNLKAHQRIHSKEKPFKCTECPKKFTHKGHLTDHLRTHTGERPFECTTCGKRFAQKVTLRNHQLTHSGVKAYKCHQCLKEFSRRYSLTRHLLKRHCL